MNTFRIVLANIRFPATSEESVTSAEKAVRDIVKSKYSAPCGSLDEGPSESDYKRDLRFGVIQ